MPKNRCGVRRVPHVLSCRDAPGRPPSKNTRWWSITWLCGIARPRESTTRALIRTTAPLRDGVLTAFERLSAWYGPTAIGPKAYVNVRAAGECAGGPKPIAANTAASATGAMSRGIRSARAPGSRRLDWLG